MSTDPLDPHASAERIVDAYRRKEVSPVDVTRRCLQRIQRLNPTLNAFYHLDEKGAQAAAQQSEARWHRGEPLGPLDGIPTSFKDRVVVDGMPTPQATRAVPYEPSDFDGSPARALRLSGGVLIGKTTMPEFGLFTSTVSCLYGVSRNPWDQTRTPGGSSGGAAASMAAGLTPLAISTDGLGSIRIPASYSGVFGLKTTAKLVPCHPDTSLQICAGPLVRNVRDAALALNVLTAPDPRVKTGVPSTVADYLDGIENGLGGARIASCSYLGYGVEPEADVLTNFEIATQSLRAIGIDIEEIPPPFERDIWTDLIYQGAAVFGRQLGALSKERQELLHPALQAVIVPWRTVTISQLRIAQDCVKMVRRVIDRLMERFDFLLTPTTATAAYDADQMFPPDAELGDLNYYHHHCPYTFLFNKTEHPAASICSGFSRDGLPTGLQIVGRLFQDADVLRLARTFERDCFKVENWPKL